jgi:hypothetical protein
MATTIEQQLWNAYDLKKSPNSNVTVRHSNRGQDESSTVRYQHDQEADDDHEGDVFVKSSDAGAPTEVMTNRTSDVLSRVCDKLLSDSDGHQSSTTERHHQQHLRYQTYKQQPNRHQDELEGPPQLKRTYLSLPIVKEDNPSRPTTPTKSSMKEKVVPSLLDACNSESISLSTTQENESYATDRGVIDVTNLHNSRLTKNAQQFHKASMSSPSSSPTESTSFKSLHNISTSIDLKMKTGRIVDVEGRTFHAASAATSVFNGIDEGRSVVSLQLEQRIPELFTSEHVGEKFDPLSTKSTNDTVLKPSRGGCQSQQTKNRSRVAALGAHLRKSRWTVRGAQSVAQQDKGPHLSYKQAGEMGYARSDVVANVMKVSSRQQIISERVDDDESTLPEERAGVDRSEEFVVYNKRVVQNARDVFQSKGFDNYDESKGTNAGKRQAPRQDSSIERGKSPIQPLFSLDRLNLSHDSEHSPIRKSHSSSKLTAEYSVRNNAVAANQQDAGQEPTCRERSSSLSRSLERKLSKEKSTATIVREALARNRASRTTTKSIEDDPDSDLDEELANIMESSGQKKTRVTTLEDRPGSAPSSVWANVMVSPSMRASPAEHATYSDHQRSYHERPRWEVQSMHGPKPASVREKIRAFNSQSPAFRKSGAPVMQLVAIDRKSRLEEEKKEEDRPAFFTAGLGHDDGSIRSLREKIKQELGINQMPSPVEHVGDDDFSVQSLRGRLEERICKLNENDYDFDDDNSVRSLREKFEPPAVKPRGDNVSSLRAMFESKPKPPSIFPQSRNNKSSHKGSGRPSVQQSGAVDYKDDVEAPVGPHGEEPSYNVDSRGNDLPAHRNSRVTEEVTALLGAYRARERKRELEAAIQTKVGVLLSPDNHETTERRTGVPASNQNSNVKVAQSRLDQWSNDRQHERQSEHTNFGPRQQKEATTSVPIISGQVVDTNPVKGRSTSANNQLIDTEGSDTSIFSPGDRSDHSCNDHKNIVPGSHWTTKGNANMQTKKPERIDAKGSSSDSDYSDAVTLDASIADVSILTNPSPIRTKESKEIDNGDKQSDSCLCILSTTKNSEALLTQPPESADPLLASSTSQVFHERRRNRVGDDKASQAVQSARRKTHDGKDKHQEEQMISGEQVEVKSAIKNSRHADSQSTGNTWTAFSPENASDRINANAQSPTMESWPNFDDEKEWIEDANGNYVPASSSDRENNDILADCSHNFDSRNLSSSVGMASTQVPNGSDYDKKSPYQKDSPHSLQSKPQIFSISRAVTPTNSVRTSSDLHSTNNETTNQLNTPHTPFLSSPSADLGFRATHTCQEPSPSNSSPIHGVSDYNKPQEDHGSNLEETRRGRNVVSSETLLTSSKTATITPPVQPVSSSLNADYDTIMSSRHKMLLSRQRALQHRKATRTRATASSLSVTPQGGFFGRTHPDRSYTPDPPSVTTSVSAHSSRSIHSVRSAPPPQTLPVSPSRSMQSTPRMFSTPPHSISPRSINLMSKQKPMVVTPKLSNIAKNHQHSSAVAFDPFGFPVYNDIDDSDQKAFETLTRPSPRRSRDPEGVRVSSSPVYYEFSGRTTSYRDVQQREDQAQKQQSSDGASFYSKVKSRLGLPSSSSPRYTKQQELSQSEAVVARISAVRAARLRRLHAYGERYAPSSSMTPSSVSKHNLSPQQRQQQQSQRPSSFAVPGYRYYTHDDEEIFSTQATGPGEEDMSLSTNNSTSPLDFVSHFPVD